MFAGNLLALLQNNVKRILAYSSIAHLGYLIVAFEAGGDIAGFAVAFYLVAYFATMLGAFGVVTMLSTPGNDRGDLGLYRGLFWRRPVIAGVFTVMLLSLAGIPLTAGFIGKFYVVAAGASVSLWLLGVHFGGHERHRSLLLPASHRCVIQPYGRPCCAWNSNGAARSLVANVDCRCSDGSYCRDWLLPEPGLTVNSEP